MQQPKRVKYRKSHRGRMSGKAVTGGSVAFGDYGLKAMEPAWITARQIESARVAITRGLKKGGKSWIRIFADKPVSKKAAETRQGGGKGNADHWVSVVKQGRILFEIAGVDFYTAREAFRVASHKLPIATTAVTRDPITAQKLEEGEPK